MRYHLAVDSGGTKVQAVLYDDAFHPVDQCRVGSMRLSAMSREAAERHAEELLAKLRIPEREMGCICGIVEPVLQEKIQPYLDPGAVVSVTEADMGFGACGVTGDACLTVAGTGATVFVRKGEQLLHAGGYGSAVADEGSGYWIGRMALGAAIHDYEGRGPKTLLTDLLAARMGGNRESFRERVFSYMYGDHSCEVLSRVAGCTPLVSSAALQGDVCARNILMEAGMLLAQQACAMIRKCELSPYIPVALSGSVWRSHEILKQTFTRVLRENGALGQVVAPLFEPVMGAVIDHLKRIRGGLSPEDMQEIQKQFKDYLYRTDR